MKMSKKYLYTMNHPKARTEGGSKAKNLYFLMRHHFPVPTGWVLSWDAMTDFQSQGAVVLQTIRDELSPIIIQGRKYAIRSSASVEDDKASSCAGLFHSFLGADNLETVIEQIQAVWESSSSDEFRAYNQSRMISENAVQMGVIIQEMVLATCSGVAFSKNPLTGLSETILEVGSGTGDDQVHMKQDPERWISK